MAAISRPASYQIGTTPSGEQFIDLWGDRTPPGNTRGIMAADSRSASYQIVTTESGEQFIDLRGDRTPLGNIKCGYFNIHENRYSVFIGSRGGMGCSEKTTQFFVECPNLKELAALYRSLVQNTQRSMIMPYEKCDATEPTLLESGHYVTHLRIGFRTAEYREIFHAAFLAPLFPDLSVEVNGTSVILKVVKESTEKVNQAVAEIFRRLNEKTSCIYSLSSEEAAPDAKAPLLTDFNSDPTQNEPIVCGALLKKQIPTYHISGNSLKIGHGYAEARSLRIPTKESIAVLKIEVTDLLNRRDIAQELRPIIEELRSRVGAFDQMTPFDYEIISNLYHSATNPS